MKKLVAGLILLICLSGIALAEPLTGTNVAAPLKDVTQYTVTHGNGQRLFEIAFRADRPDTVFIIDYRDGKEYFLQPMPGNPQFQGITPPGIGIGNLPGFNPPNQ